MQSWKKLAKRKTFVWLPAGTSTGAGEKCPGTKVLRSGGEGLLQGAQGLHGESQGSCAQGDRVRTTHCVVYTYPS